MSDYTTQVLGAAPTPNNAEWFSAQMEQLDRQLHKMKKHKKGKKGKGRKKLKKRLKEMELRCRNLEQFISFAMYQSQLQASTPQKSKKSKKGKKRKKVHQLWWQETMTNSLPKVLELATISMSRLPPRSQPALALPEGQCRK